MSHVIKTFQGESPVLELLDPYRSGTHQSGGGDYFSNAQNILPPGKPGQHCESRVLWMVSTPPACCKQPEMHCSHWHCEVDHRLTHWVATVKMAVYLRRWWAEAVHLGSRLFTPSSSQSLNATIIMWSVFEAAKTTSSVTPKTWWT